MCTMGIKNINEKEAYYLNEWALLDPDNILLNLYWENMII